MSVNEGIRNRVSTAVAISVRLVALNDGEGTGREFDHHSPGFKFLTIRLSYW